MNSLNFVLLFALTTLAQTTVNRLRLIKSINQSEPNYLQRNTQSEKLTLEQAKRQLEELQMQLLQIDQEQRKEINQLEKQSQQKGEFETTQQFKSKEEKLEQQITNFCQDIEHQSGANREEVYKQINEILSAEFSDKLKANLGYYAADNQYFPLILEDGFQAILPVPFSEAKTLKDNFAEAVLSGKVALSLDENNKAKEYLITATIKFRDKTYKTVETNLNVGKAMTMIFGNYNPQTRKSYWRDLTTENGCSVESEETQRLPATFLVARDYQQNGVKKKIFVTQMIPSGDADDYSCHACGLVVGLAVFANVNNEWKIEQVKKNIGRHGAWGKVELPELIKIGNEKFALKFSWFDMGQGQEEGGENYLAIANKAFQEILNLKTYESNLAALSQIKGQFISESKVKFIPKADSDFFDIQVTTIGKKAEKIGQRYILRPFSKVEIYKVIGSTYQLVQ